MKSYLKTVKNIGTAHNGVTHWWMQRLTAIALLLFAIWFATNVVCLVFHQQSFSYFLSNRIKTILFSVFLITALYHSALGIKVVIEDYVSCPVVKFTMIISVNFLAIITAILLIL